MDFTFKIAGEAGYGIAVSGLILAKTAQRSGYFVFDFNEYPSLIRGGHNVYGARVSDRAVHSPVQPVDFLIAFNQAAVDLHQSELPPGGSILVNADRAEVKNPSLGMNIFPIPLSRLAQENGGEAVMMNNVALGATVFLLGGDFSILESAIKDSFSSLKPEVVDLNVRLAQAGYDFAKKNFQKPLTSINLKKRKAGPRLLLTGNDALALGMVQAGCKFLAAYPMTPINSLIAYFAARGKELGMVYYQPEDEIAGINSAIGASLCGLRSAVATSGGGFALMTEALGLAGMTETPLVVIEGQRPGPSTGLPTWTSQGDLRFVLAAGQDDFPRIVLVPGDQAECFWLTLEAFNLADKYQTPVVILVDKFLCESRQSCELFDEKRPTIDRGIRFSPGSQPENFLRYQITENGISPRIAVGQGDQVFITNSDEHNERGFSDESSENRKAMMDKRMRKMETLAKELPRPDIYGEPSDQILLVGWGSTKGQALEAQKKLAEEGIRISYLHLNHLSPFPEEFVSESLKRFQKVLLVEQNFTAQLAGLIREKTGFEIKEKLLKYDGRPFSPEEIIERVKKL